MLTSNCANCGSEMELTRAVWWTATGICCAERCARELTETPVDIPSLGALARAEALAAGDADWMGVTQWPRSDAKLASESLPPEGPAD